jgi:hypothetical protein
MVIGLTFTLISIESTMRMRLKFVLMLLIIACAHKAPPIAKDRLNPKLVRVEVLNTRQIQLSFSENLDTTALATDSIAVASGQDTLAVLQAYPSLSASEVILITEPMKNITYDIRGVVFDEAENKGNFKSPFQGSIYPDTIAPWLIGHSQGRNKQEFFLTFSEAMDTMSLAFSIIPKKAFIPIWVNSRYARFIPATAGESLGFDTTYYLYLKQARDISGNKSGPYMTSITPDTVYRPIILKGKAMIGETPLNSGLALLERIHPIAIALVTKGEFSFEVRDSLAFDAQIIADGYSGKGTVKAGADNILKLEKGKIEIDRLID